MKWGSRLRLASKILRTGIPGPPPWLFKSLPMAWPDWRQEKPVWRLVDVKAFIDEGFSMNSLIYSAIMYKVRATIPAPLKAYTGDPTYPVELKRDDPLAQRIVRPNDHQSWTEFHSLNYVYLNISGDAFIYKDPTSGEMHPLRPDRVRIIPSKGKPATLKGFVYVPEGKMVSQGWPILPEDMMHIKLPNPADPLEGMGHGLSPLAPAAQSADIDNMITHFLNIFFKKGAMLLGLLKFDAALDPDKVEEIRARWMKRYGGYEKWGVGVLDRGGEYKRVGLTFEEMGFKDLDARDETRILSPFGVHPILIGSKVGLDRATYSNQQGAREGCWQDTLYPELILFQVEYQKHLNTDNAFVLFDVSQIPALQTLIPKLVNAAYQMCQIGIPPNQAVRAVGLSSRIGYIEGGDESVADKLGAVAKEVHESEQELVSRAETDVGGVYDA